MAKLTRRNLLSALPAVGASPGAALQSSTRRPNILFVISDQFRADNLGCLGQNPMNLTPNLDAMAARGTLFRQAISNQPVCAPARATMFTGQYPSMHGVWRNGPGLKANAATLASTLRKSGYSANYIGKWHLSQRSDATAGNGPVPPAHRGGFDDFWEASNALELTSHPFEGEMYASDGAPIRFSGQYRADFLTERAVRFLKGNQRKDPFLLVVSYLEVHHQNDSDLFVPPKKYQGKFQNPFAPHDLRPLPGTWPSQLPGYYGSVAGIDDAMGTLLGTLKEQGIENDTIVVFISDHGCHFRTRNTEYKRSPHESSIHIPLIIQGPGFNHSLGIEELVSQVDVTPTLLEAAGVAIPSTMQGRSLLPLLARKTEGWPNDVYVEISESLTGRALRTPRWTYAVANPQREPASDHYREYMLYDLFADPWQHVNLAGRAEYKDVSGILRARLLARIAEAGGPTPVIEPPFIPYV